MTLYEINTAITSLINPETGEIEDFEAFEQLNLAKDEKIENIGLWIKNLLSDSKAIREEEKALAARREALENKAERLKTYLLRMLDGNKFSTPKISIGFRKSKAVKIDDSFIEWAKANNASLLRFAEPTADKTAIKQALLDGAEIPAELVENVSVSIK